MYTANCSQVAAHCRPELVILLPDGLAATGRAGLSGWGGVGLEAVGMGKVKLGGRWMEMEEIERVEEGKVRWAALEEGRDGKVREGRGRGKKG